MRQRRKTIILTLVAFVLGLVCGLISYYVKQVQTYRTSALADLASKIVLLELSCGGESSKLHNLLVRDVAGRVVEVDVLYGRASESDKAAMDHLLARFSALRKNHRIVMPNGELETAIEEILFRHQVRRGHVLTFHN
jgi:hypothetical protein